MACPDFISDESLTELGKYFKKTQKFPALGIITAKSIESAEKLGNRAPSVKFQTGYMASDIDKYGGLKSGIITTVNQNGFTGKILNRENMIEALAEAD